MNITNTPMSERATTRIPETAPPRSEIRRASATECWAAAAVRRFDFTATNMPRIPEAIEQRAPTKNAIEVLIASSSFDTPGADSKV